MADEEVKLSDIQRLEAERIAKRSTNSSQENSGGFERALAEQIQKSNHQVTFSNHALQRLQKRQIDFGAERMERLETAVSTLSGKGARRGLVLLDDLALVVGVKHRTVITAMDRESMKGSVITNIDSAIIT